LIALALVAPIPFAPTRRTLEGEPAVAPAVT
jgi:hypothetical protein